MEKSEMSSFMPMLSQTLAFRDSGRNQVGARIWNTPTPIGGTPEKLTLWVQVLTGEELDFQALIARQKITRPVYQGYAGEQIPLQIRIDNEVSESRTKATSHPRAPVLFGPEECHPRGLPPARQSSRRASWR